VKVTVITVAWNAAATIGDTVRSVAAQSHDALEHLIIDGASTDATAAIVASVASPRTRFISAPDRGLYDAMNKGVAQATGDLIGFLNADDFFCRTDSVTLLAKAAGEHAAVSGGVAIVPADSCDKLVRAYPSQPFAPWMLRFGHMPPHPGFYTSRAAFDRVGGFDPSIRIGADFEWMVRFFAVHGLKSVPIRETLVTLREGGLSNSGFVSRRTINSEAVISLRRHGIATSAPLVWSKYAAKVMQFGMSAYQWPAPELVQWPAAREQQ
jgi:glycosyltransferase involved in cell wall biosynthesis